ncbi:EF-hand domain-containing protein [Allorhodopirellula solitaria]|nr:EF-hand domain-containing protein [Allorhodopirellula solitaria]
MNLSSCLRRVALTMAIASFSLLSVHAQRGGGGGRDGGGGRGGRGGGGGGGSFDPSGFLSRLDRNGNGMLDPDEQEGRMGEMVERMASADPSIKPGRPIPMSKLTEAFSKMRSGGDRGGGGRGGDDRGRGGDDRGRGGDRGRGDDRGDENEDPTAVAPLVPGFGVDIPVLPLLGFGPSAEIMAVVPAEEDLEEARNNLRRYDRNRDGQLDAEEIRRGGFWGDPMDFDRNGDGKLSEQELATREAVERNGKEANRQDRRDNPQSEVSDSEGGEFVDFEGRRSYRVYSAESPEGLPRFFTDRDLNRDGQVSMSEYTSEWTSSLVAEFYDWDANHDGVIVASEVLKGVNGGLTASATRSGTAPQNETTVSRSSSASSGSSRSATSDGGATAEKLEMPSEPPTEKILSMAKTIIKRYDKNGDFALSAAEWGEMMISPAGADFNGDGRITVEEYAGFLTAKSKRLK